MLKSELIIPRLKKRGNEIVPLALPADYHYLKIATELIEIVKAYLGKSRGQLDQALRIYEGDSLDYRIIRGLANVLMSRCVFAHDLPVSPVILRKALFQKGPVTVHNDLLNIMTRQKAVAEAAAQFKLTSQQIEQALFADLLEERILISLGDIMKPVEIIARYNLEVARGVLYWARGCEMIVQDGYKDLFKFIKLFKLMHTIYPLEKSGYKIILHGPISPFVNSTMRYGLQFAKFLPALLLCKNWSMNAEIQLPENKEPLHYHLDDSTDLNSHFKQSKLFDSRLEEDFSAEFEAKYGGVKRKWTLAREDELIIMEDTVMIPDFSLTHNKDGRRALIEIIGFWHPQYLQRKLKKVRVAGRHDLILLIYASANVAEGVFEEVAAGEVLIFTKKPVLKDVLAAVERCAI